MSSLKTRKIKTSLKKKGFKEGNGDHKYYFLYINDRKTSIFTKISHGEGEINDFLIKQMSKQTRLEKNEFLDLINCPLSYEEYIELLKQRGHLIAK